MPHNTRLRYLALMLIAVALWQSVGRSDFVIYSVPGGKIQIVLEGKTKVLGSGIIEYTHPTFGQLVLGKENAVIIKAPTRQDEFKRLFAKAQKSKNIDDYLKAAGQALQRGLLKEFYECCSAAYKTDPENETVKRLIAARKMIKQPLSDSSETERKLRTIADRPSMKIETSAHYVLLHDTDATKPTDPKAARRGQTRAKARLELLEQVYEAYFMKFALEGLLLEAPKDHMMVLLFAEETDYKHYSTQLNPALQTAAGFWSPKDNVSVFFDHSSTVKMRELASLAQEAQEDKLKTRGTAAGKETAHFANTIELISKVAREEADIEVVSHEATHQLAGNSGLFPRNKIVTRWAHEGLASYFETPSGAGWGGIGAVNKERLQSYYRVSSDSGRAPLEFLVSDVLFDGARSNREVVDAYGQAWALTHYLMEKKFTKLMIYYKRVSELDAEKNKITRGDLVEVFNSVFGDIRMLERDFHAYMEILKTDIDRLADALR